MKKMIHETMLWTIFLMGVNSMLLFVLTSITGTRLYKLLDLNGVAPIMFLITSVFMLFIWDIYTRDLIHIYIK